MKRLVFAFLVAVASVICIGLILRTQDVRQTADASIKLGLRSETAHDIFVLTGSGDLLSSVSSTTENIKAEALGMMDLVLYDRNSPDPVIAQNTTKTTIQIGKGLYLFSTNDLFQTYEIFSDTFSIKHAAKGVFFVDSRADEIRIYSLSALLDIDLLTNKTPVTKVSVFPSMLFIYNPTYNTDLANVDAFRIAQVNTLRMVDLNTTTGSRAIFSENDETPTQIMSAYKAYSAKRDASFRDFYKAFQISDDKSDLSLMDRYAILFVNDEKKRSILMNSLIESLQRLLLLDKNLCDTACKKTTGSQDALIKNITDRIASLDATDSSNGESARSLVRRYIALATLQTEKKSEDYFRGGKSPFVMLVSKVFDKRVVLDERYRLLSEIYSSYYFAGATKDETAKNIENFIRLLVDDKIIGEKDFLSFVFFLKEYLSLQSSVINANTLNITYNMVRIADAYFITLGTDEQKFLGLSTLFYTFNTIFDGIRENSLTQFFDGTQDNLTLKSQYLNGDNPNISSDFLVSYKKTLESLTDLLTRKNAEFYTLLWTKQGDTTDNFAILSATADKLKTLRDIFVDYSAYRKNLTLNDSTRNATGILFGGTKLSKESLQTYLARFEGVNISTLEVLNDFEKDNAYDVRITIGGQPFSFTLREPGNILTNLIYVDETGNTNENFKSAAISLDDREKLSKERVAMAQTADDRAKYDFRNYFKATFFKAVDLPVVTTTGPVIPSHPEMSPDMQLTVQHELIEKDFRNLSTFAPIAIKNIYAKIDSGIYDIDLFGVRFSLRGVITAYPIEMTSKYIFTDQEHAFSGISFKVLKDNPQDGYMFGGVDIHVIPNKIDLASFQNSLANAGQYLDVLRRQGVTNPESVSIDLTNQQIFINGTPFPVTFSK